MRIRKIAYVLHRLNGEESSAGLLPDGIGGELHVAHHLAVFHHPAGLGHGVHAGKADVLHGGKGREAHTVHEYEIGDIVYWHPGPTCAMYYDHDGRTIAAGMEVIARMDQAGIEALGAYANDVEVTISVAR